MTNKIYTAIGLMSGTSLDGIDAALIKTDGYDIIDPIGFITTPYSKELQEKLRACLGKTEDSDGFIAAAAHEMTQAHAQSVTELLAKYGLSADEIDLIGFHGQTIHHDPDNRFTWQIGDGALLAEATDIDTVNDLRMADVAAGGQGAPLLPVYHAARLRSAATALPVAVLNIGGVSNVTWIDADNNLLAYDTGPGNALLNDWIKTHTGAEYDQDGKTAKSGTADNALIEKWLTAPYFDKLPPKSLDRDEWHIEGLETLSLEDGAATLTAFTVRAIAKSFTQCPQMPKACYVTGGGRHNSFMMESLQKALPNTQIGSVDELGWSGDAVEAEGFAYMAVRSVLGEAISFPRTTGCPVPMTGGTLHKADKSLRKAS